MRILVVGAGPTGLSTALIAFDKALHGPLIRKLTAL
jgi:thioredoxin reductase